MPKQNDVVIIDTNLWISFLLTKDFSKLDAMFADDQLTLVFSEELMEEFLEVTQRVKFKKYFSRTDVDFLLRKLADKAIFVQTISVIEKCKDPKDNFLLALAIDANATHLLTGDKDLLVLRKIGKTKIITISEYLPINST
jgi:uncharacterized protein